MKCKMLSPNENEINKFLASPGIKFVSCRFIPAHEGDADIIVGAQVAVFYTTAEDDQAAKDRAIIEQNAQMDRLLDIAREVAKEGKFASLKNNTQRELFLAAKYNLQPDRVYRRVNGVGHSAGGMWGSSCAMTARWGCVCS